jgi:ABC-type dipeptide/oligopeptide/nickel transport system permease subunit
LAPWIAPYSPFVTSGPSYAVPTWSHLLGTDDIGEDIFSQLIFAARGSLLVAFGAGVLSTGIGIFVGLVSGYYAGRLGEGLMRVTDVMLVLPVLPLLIVIAAFFPPSVWLVIVVIGIVSWAPTARVIRSQTLSLKARPFVDSCRLSGMSDFEVMFRVLLRNEIPLIIVYGVYTAITAVVLESALDFIGLGSVENLSWGVMLYFALARNALARGSWWWFLPPGFLIALLGTGLILTGYAVERVSRTGL